MNRPITAILLSVLAVGVCQPAQAVEETFDISGYELFGDFDVEFPSFSTSFGLPGTVTEIAIDAVGESFGESWNSEITFSIDTDSQFVDIFEDLGLPDSSGPFSIATTVPVSVGSIDGEVFLTLSEDFVDGESPDSAFGADSSVTITFDPYVPVPAPEATDLGLIAAADTPFSIDTFGSSFDTELGLYDGDGIFIDENDDANPGVHSELELAGGLPSGGYYLAIGGHDTEFGPLGFDAVPLSGSVGGDFLLNLPTGSANGVLAPEAVEFFSFSIGASNPSADFDEDGDIDGDDFLIWQDSFSIHDGGDADDDGDTDGDDFLIWQSQFGSAAVGSAGASRTPASTPEPAAAILVTISAAIILFTKPRRRSRLTRRS